MAGVITKLRMPGAKWFDMTGLVFGALTVVRVSDDDRRQWVCRCECGVECIVPGYKLRKAAKRSCGCRQPHSEQHGMGSRFRRTPEYTTWANIIQRCENPSQRCYARYGGRGIAVCERWRYSFTSFLADMGPRPSAEHSIDRIDPNGHYEPGNCRWATRAQQARNKRNNRYVELNGVVVPLKEAAKAMCIGYSSMHARFRNGVPIDQDRKSWLRVGETYQSLDDWSSQTGIPRHVIKRRIHLGWSSERAVSQPARTWGSLYPVKRSA